MATIHSDTQTFGRFGQSTGSGYVLVRTNGGTLTITSLMSDGYEIPVDNGVISNDSSFPMDFTQGRFKFTPSGGCVYEVRV